ncbi:hypothetical protein [Paenibacillus xylanexedens]|uniref:hypothetical protein n=1 Tax=Paenibacillus xylanexedens TaxID=528191 RepID=UPI0011A66A0A|nr:hypothetical protein [Paenibacillus xylanexedens]
MDNTESYAVWYSSVTNYDKIMAQFVQDENGTCKFEQDFDLADEYLDYDHTVILWYGQQHGELGAVTRSQNANLDEGFSYIIDPVAELLQQQGIEQISYLFAMPDLEYEGEVRFNDSLVFLGNVKCEQEISEWMAELLRDM